MTQEEGGICGSVRPFTSQRCKREAGHHGQHGTLLQGRIVDGWGGKSSVHSAPKIKPLPDRPLAPYRVPAIPAGKFDGIEGQAAMDFSRDEWDALTEPGS